MVRIPSFVPAFLIALGAFVGVQLLDPAVARAEPVPLSKAQQDLAMLKEQLGDKKMPNEDLIGSISALAAAFFNIEPFAEPEPTDPGADAADPDKAKFQAEHKAWSDKRKKHEAEILAFQDACLDLFVKAVRVVQKQAGKGGDNLRNDVNLRAAQALGEILGSADLAKNRDAKAVEKLRGDQAKELMGILEKDFDKRNKDEIPAPAGLTEAVCLALGRTNELKVLEWLTANFVHTNNGTYHEERLVAAHKAMKMFTNVPARQRHVIAGTMITVYSGTEGSTNQVNSSDPKTRQQAQAAKAFWDKIKTGVIECVNYYATAPGGGPPVNAEGNGLTTMKDLQDWWRKNDKLGRGPWVDPKVDPKGK